MSEFRAARRGFRRERIDYDRADLTALAVRTRGGDTAAEEAFIRRTMPDVRRYCTFLVGADLADDATQATYLRALRSIRSFRGDASAKTWLLGVARFTCLDELRSRGRRQRIVDRVAHEAAAGVRGREEAAAVLADAQDVLDANDALAAVGALGVDRREAFVLTQVLGYSYEEAAAVVDCPIGTIRSRVARARAELIAELRPAEARPGAVDPADLEPVGRRSALNPP